MRVSVEKGYVPGCIGRICELHTRYYSKLVGFGLPFESKVVRELAEFCTRYDDQRDGLWFSPLSSGHFSRVVIFLDS
jgi:hypothetical protein